MRLGIPFSCYIKPAYVGKKDGVHRRESYWIECKNYIGRSMMHEILGTDNDTNRKYNKNTIVKSDNCVYHPIKEIDCGKYTGYVYNLHVENNNNYVLSDCLVHNCFSKDPQALECTANELGIECDFIKAMEEYNKMIRGDMYGK
jgi:hypothetical protein